MMRLRKVAIPPGPHQVHLIYGFWEKGKSTIVGPTSMVQGYVRLSRLPRYPNARAVAQCSSSITESTA